MAPSDSNICLMQSQQVPKLKFGGFIEQILVEEHIAISSHVGQGNH